MIVAALIPQNLHSAKLKEINHPSNYYGKNSIKICKTAPLFCKFACNIHHITRCET